MTSERRNLSILLGAMIIVAGIALVVMSVVLTKETGGRGSESEILIYYGLENVIMAIFGGMLISGGGSYLALSRSGGSRGRVPIPEIASGDANSNDGKVSASLMEREERNERSGLVLRLLEGDERVMYRTILEEGGEVLQKDLMEKTKMSNAKVTRVLDRLEDKELIVRERHGMTNRVRIDGSK